MYHLSMWCALQNSNLKIILHVMCPGSIKKPSRCNGFDKHCQESVLDSFPVSILKGLAFSSCKGHCECSDLKPYFPDPAFFKKNPRVRKKGLEPPLILKPSFKGFFLSYPYLHVYVLHLPQLRCANFMEFLLQFCLMIEAMVAAKNTLVLVWCSAGCHRSVTFACPLAQEGAHSRLRLWLKVRNS